MSAKTGDTVLPIGFLGQQRLRAFLGRAALSAIVCFAKFYRRSAVPGRPSPGVTCLFPKVGGCGEGLPGAVKQGRREQ